jgi:L-fucose mutarotase
MLTGISPLLSPELLATMCRMGHGDELVLADAHFPAESVNARVLRADGLRIADLLDAALPLFALDAYVPDPVVMMAPVAGDAADPAVHARYRAAIERHHPTAPGTAFIPRFDFYDRAHRAFAVVVTGETAKYGNILLKKGITPVVPSSASSNQKEQ